MILREAALVTPLTVYALAVALGASRGDLFLPFAVCQVAGMILYLAEVRYRFRNRNGRR